MNASLRAAIVVAGLGAALGGVQADQAPRAGAVTMRVIDASSRSPLANQAVEVASDNGVRCIRAPCPTNDRKWQGTTDAQGRVRVPAGFVQEVTRIRALPDGEWAEVAMKAGVQDVAVVRR